MLRTRWLVPGVVMLGAAVTVAASLVNWYVAESVADDRLETVADSLGERLEQELDRAVDLASAIAVGLPPRGELDSDAWQQIMADLDVAGRHPAVFGNSYNQRVARVGLDGWIAERVAEDEEFELRSDAGGPTLQVIRYAWPLPATAPSVGLDVLMSPLISDAFTRADATGEPTFSSAFQSSSLPEGAAATALVMAVEGRDSHVILLLAGDTLLSALEPLPAAVGVALLEPGSEAFPVLATLPGPGGEVAVGADGSLAEHQRTHRVPVGPPYPGWELAVIAAPGLVPPMYGAGPWIALVLGAMITALAGVTVHSLRSRERLAARRVEEATTELAAANLALVGADRHKDAFLASVSHELRTPLTAIAGFLETLRRIPPDQLPTAMLLDALERNTRRLLTLVDDLLLLASLDAGAARVQAESVTLAQEVPALVADLGVDPAACRFDLPDGLVARVDRRHLERIVTNLVMNALRHGEPPISIRAAEDDASVVMAVADNGAGLHPADGERVFDRFARGRDADQSTGTGLGLAVVRELAEANGGEIAYRFCEDGPCFVLTLPRSR